MISFSPLRYPGGKQTLANILACLIRENNLEGGAYAEPYAGGCGAALALLYWEYVKTLLLNDADPCIHALWKSILEHTNDFCKRIRDVPLSTEEWKKQKAIYARRTEHSTLDVGFATFYLNRTNRSGIIKNGGPIGGYDQSGPWKIDARFNRTGLIQRVERIALYRERVIFTGKDAIEFIKDLPRVSKMFVYLDPPYYAKGSELYLNHYDDKAHTELASFITKQSSLQWAMTYDRAARIKKLYKGFRQVPFTFSYSATGRSTGKELLIASGRLKLPDSWKRRLPRNLITMARVTV